MKDNFDIVDLEDQEVFINWCNNLSVPKVGRNFDRLIEEHSKEVKNRKIRDKERFIDYLSFEAKWNIKKTVETQQMAILNIEVSAGGIKRAYIFMNYFMECVKRLGGRVTVEPGHKDNTIVYIGSLEFDCRLYERKVKYREIKNSDNRSMKPLYDLIPTGDLVFELKKTGEKKWMQYVDEIEERIENKIGKIFQDLHPHIMLLKRQAEELEAREEAKRKERELQEEIELLQEEKRKQEIEAQKVADAVNLKMAAQRNCILNHMQQWNQFKQVTEYLNELKESCGEELSKGEIEMYCSRVRELYRTELFYEEIKKFLKTIK